MATVGEAIAATLIAQWTAAGGAQPDPIQYLVERPERDPNPTVADAVYVWLPLRRKFDPVDVKGTYRNVTYTIRIVCHTKTSSARQKEIENEVDRVLNSGTPITGATKQRVKEINDISNRSYSVLPKYISEVIVEVFTAMEVSATAYGTATATTFETDVLTVNTSILNKGTSIFRGNMDVEDGARLRFENQGAGIDPYFTCDAVNQYLLLSGGLKMSAATLAGGPSCDFIRDEDDMSTDSATSLATQQSIKAYIDAVNMIGSTNAAWVPCVLFGTSNHTDPNIVSGLVEPSDTTDKQYYFLLTQPTNRGALNLHVKDVKIDLFDADASSYITYYKIYGLDHNSLDTINDDATDLTTAASHTDPFTAVDCSAYEQIVVRLDATIVAAADLDIAAVLLHCYYA